jgi:hypothetical protein
MTISPHGLIENWILPIRGAGAGDGAEGGGPAETEAVGLEAAVARSAAGDPVAGRATAPARLESLAPAEPSAWMAGGGAGAATEPAPVGLERAAGLGAACGGAVPFEGATAIAGVALVADGPGAVLDVEIAAVDAVGASGEPGCAPGIGFAVEATGAFSGGAVDGPPTIQTASAMTAKTTTATSGSQSFRGTVPTGAAAGTWSGRGDDAWAAAGGSGFEPSPRTRAFAPSCP